jgi:uncharacterized membrane protein
MPVTTAQSAQSAQLRRLTRRRALFADVVLAALVLGPLAAPLLYASGLFGPRLVAGVISTMGSFVCPQPGRAVALYDGQLMAVCMRCYGTVLGLLATRLLYAVDQGAGAIWLSQYRMRALPIFAALIFSYAAEYAGQVAGLWRFDNGAVTVAGLLTGVGLGLMFHPLLHDARQQRDEPSASATYADPRSYAKTHE